MSHIDIPFDAALLDEITARLELRAPNREAIEAVAKKFDGAAGTSFEAVCNLATGVGKTYVAAGLIEYLAAQGVRHFIIVTPGKTIQNKTIANFTPGSRKSVLGGMEYQPVVITAEDFARGSVRAALDDTSQVKLFVFNVQQLLAPTANMSRRTRKFQETLGRPLYEHLRSLPDLVVLADEHHVYQEKAQAFSSAIRDLDPLALVGLTATPDKASRDKIVYEYPLARAIADKFVKTPVLVGRKDDRSDIETKLRDGLTLLDAKRRAVEAWCTATGAAPVNPVMFVVGRDIDDANAISETLRRLLDNYDDAVLTVHSESPDDALAKLEAVEDPSSKVRVIVSVSMLKEGWDVKNIWVICSLKPSLSETLTEQTLGRGLRLPWGKWTDVELLDTVEVISHDRYEKLLEKAGVLVEGLVVQRATNLVPVPAPAARPASSTPGGTATPAPAPAPTVHVETGTDDGPTSTPDAGTGATADSTGAAVPAVLVSSVEDRTTTANVEAEALEMSLTSSALTLPRVRRIAKPRTFSLSVIPDGDFEQLGRLLSAQPGGDLRRKRLDIVADPTAPTGVRLVPVDAVDVIHAATPNLPLEEARTALVNALLNTGLVAADRPNINAANRLAAALIKGAGDNKEAEEHLAWFLNTAIDGVSTIVNTYYKQAPVEYDTTVETFSFAPVRPGRPTDPNRHGEFSRKVGYTNWSKGVSAVEWFDSKTERTLANLLDGAAEVEVWARFHRGEYEIAYDGGLYNPDFYTRTSDGTHWLLEVKADKEMENEQVLAKKKAAELLARFLTDQGDAGRWRYALLGETAVGNARDSWPVLLAQAGIT